MRGTCFAIRVVAVQRLPQRARPRQRRAVPRLYFRPRLLLPPQHMEDTLLAHPPERPTQHSTARELIWDAVLVLVEGMAA